MAKIIRTPLEWDRSKSYSWNLANTINKHWKLEVAWPVGDGIGTGQAVSSLVSGVPPQAFERDSGYTHPDIVYIKIDTVTGRWALRVPANS